MALAIRRVSLQAAVSILLRPKRLDSGIPRLKIFGHNAPGSAVCRRPIGETMELQRDKRYSEAVIFGGLRQHRPVLLPSRRTTMTLWCFKLAGRFLSAALLTGLLWTATDSAASAQQVPADQIIKALTPAPVTRGLGGSQPSIGDSDRAFIESLRH